MATLFLSLPLPDDGGRLVRHHFGEATEMICPLRKARDWVQCPAWTKDEGRSGRQCAMPGNADLLDCQGQPQPHPLRSGKHTTIAQQESGCGSPRQAVGAIPTSGSKSGDPPPSNGERKQDNSSRIVPGAVVDFSAACRTAEKLTPRVCIFVQVFSLTKGGDCYGESGSKK